MDDKYSLEMFNKTDKSIPYMFLLKPIIVYACYFFPVWAILGARSHLYPIYVAFNINFTFKIPSPYFSNDSHFVKILYFIVMLKVHTLAIDIFGNSFSNWECIGVFYHDLDSWVDLKASIDL